jgi:hypothetical protein
LADRKHDSIGICHVYLADDVLFAGDPDRRFRAILNRIGANELAPRDLVRMQIGIPTGLVAGIAVGLFLSPSSVPMQGAGAVSGQLTLTASGLGFLAGYASYSFFGFLDNLIRTVFPVLTPNPAATSESIFRVTSVIGG